MTNPTSLQERSEQLRVLARFSAEREGDLDERERVVRALDELEVEATLLKGILDTWRAAESAEIVAQPSLGRWVQSVQELKRLTVTVGRPKADKVRGTITTLRRDRTRLGSELKDAWGKWATVQVGNIPQEKLALLPASDRPSARNRLQQLSIDAKSSPTLTMIRTFHLNLTSLHHELAEVSADAVLSSALRRLDESPPPSLGDFTDEELHALREHPDIAGQVLMRRR